MTKKLTYLYVKEYIENRDNKLISITYTNNQTKLKINVKTKTTLYFI